MIRFRAREDREGPARTPWADTHHAAGRLLSYFLAVRVLLSACRLWPELFVDFSVVAVPSSVPDRDSPAIRRSAAGIVNRMTRDAAALYRRHAADLQALGLDERIRDITHPRRFAPIVHAEVLVDDHIRRGERADAARGDEPSPYFREAQFGRYIGSSKPTCRLCALYFAAHPDDVQVRPSHGNLYHNWRAADVRADDANVTVADEQRRAALEQVVVGIRNDAVRALRNQSAARNWFDSNNTPSNPLQSTDRGDYSTASITAAFDSLSVYDDSTSPSYSREATPTLLRAQFE